MATVPPPPPPPSLSLFAGRCVRRGRSARCEYSAWERERRRAHKCYFRTMVIRGRPSYKCHQISQLFSSAQDAKKVLKNPRNKLHPSSSFFLVLLLLCNLEMPTSGEEIPLFSAKSECVCLCSSLFFSPSWYHYRSCLPLSGGVGGMCLFAAQAHQPTQNQPRPLLSLVYFCSSSFSSRVCCGAVPNMMQSPLSLNKLPN